ncbi:FAD-dependent oxidoreductase [Flavobacteriaceae bacterium F89]|uniref:FAD-dependent oxidoreductase n=1 Tax=Cerina litoralis TaxID=2874477 RepID=A0AAE3EY35_9FLAO|nr:FAD-dependent oxidoreductase [Cerina litoralis]MCG2461842.1 FAD-dependent oxidoreductase [Cerina litoralis]
MKRRNFIGNISAGGGAFIVYPLTADLIPANTTEPCIDLISSPNLLKADLIVAGGGLGGCAAAHAALRNGLTVIMTEETDWIGGQLTQQGVPPDEHKWIEKYGATSLYREFRTAVRNYYRDNYPLSGKAAAAPLLNPGNAMVSALSHEPKVALMVLEQMFAPYISARKLMILREYRAVKATTNGNVVRSLLVASSRNGSEKRLEGGYFVDATELGDLLPMTGTAYVTGAESNRETGELHAAKETNANNNQAFTVCFAMDYLKGEDWVIQKPEEYEFWRDFVPNMSPPWSGRLLDLSYSNPKTLHKKTLGFHPEGIPMGDTLNLWNYRRIIDKENFVPGFYQGDISIVNWPQNDYFLGNIVDVDRQDFDHHFDRGKQLSLSLFYWLQTEVPRPDGGRGWPGLRLRNDIMGTEDGLAKYPYIRESRRIKALFTVLEEHVGAEQRKGITGANDKELKAKIFEDSVGIGYYHIDLHPSTAGDNYIDFNSLRFQIPLGALIPQQMENLLPANKNIGTTHITNGCYRLHPVEWGIGEAVGMLVPFLMDKNLTPQEMYKNPEVIREFQEFVRTQGIDTEWPED